MRHVPFASTVAGFCLMALSVPAGFGQGMVVGFTGSGGLGMGPGMTGMPYSAVRKTTRVQKLADGTTITNENTVKEARDSNGRTYRENQIKTFGGNSDQGGFSVFSVFDPENRITMNWNSNSKQVTLIHMPEPRQLPNQIRPVPPATAVTLAQQPAIQMPQTKLDRENLGMKTIDGLEVKGTRVTQLIPVGREGNDRPLTVTTETWFCPDLKIMVESINDDPRSGTSTMELTNVDRGEPDPTLFQPPAGYTVKEQFPGQQN
jgi:hypothetical protein